MIPEFKVGEWVERNCVTMQIVYIGEIYTLYHAHSNKYPVYTNPYVDHGIVDCDYTHYDYTSAARALLLNDPGAHYNLSTVLHFRSMDTSTHHYGDDS